MKSKKKKRDETSEKISKLVHEGKEQKQAVAIALSMMSSKKKKKKRK